ncbi:transposable element Tcb1 transposase [Trichonephila clavipes]|nr:transposable element Tcb1 transposase [Trichonephila clavipes]
MSYDYTACKRSLECLFGLSALGKIKNPIADSHRQSLGASLWEGNCASKLLAVIGITYMWSHAKKVIPASGEYTSFGMAHDGPHNGCQAPFGERQHVMSPHLNSDTSPLVWSNCSRDEITKFLEYVSEVLFITAFKGITNAQVAPETTPNEDRYLAVTAKRNRRSTASDLSRQLSSATGTTVSRKTVYRHLGHIGLYARRPVRCVLLTATHCRLRLTWSREHALWTPQQWYCVMFSDESRFSLKSDSRRTLIWRAPGTRYHQENTIERHRYGGAGWLLWGGIILGSRTDPHVQSVTMTGHIYRYVILEQHVRLFRGAMDAEFLFMDDNARPHRANIVDECLQSEDITHMDWPAYSPDLNPIEHVRDWGNCLDDEPSDHEFYFPELPPGAMYDAHHQCRLQYGPDAEHCEGIEVEYT